MSVILHSTEEVVDAIASSWNRGSIGSLDNMRHMEELAEAGRRIQVANMLAYNHTYADDITLGDPPITARMIKGALISQTVERKTRGMRVLRGLRYNLIANNGRDFASAEILDDLLGMFSAVLDKSLARAA
jgi:hypothetical protein